MMLDQSDDRALLARVADGDRAALEALYRLHAGWLTARLQSRCGDPDLADIATQDTFLAAWKSAKKYRGDGDVGAWLWGIGIRRLIDVLRKRRATPIDPAHLAIQIGARDSDSLEELAIGGIHGDLDAAMQSLPSHLQAVLIATAIDGLTTREAAHLLGLPQGPVKTRLMRARHHMQEALA